MAAIDEFMKATQKLADAAAEIRRQAEHKPLDEALREAIKVIVPEQSKRPMEAAQRLTIKDLYGFDPKPYRPKVEDKPIEVKYKPGSEPPKFPEPMKQAAKDEPKPAVKEEPKKQPDTYKVQEKDTAFQNHQREILRALVQHKRPAGKVKGSPRAFQRLARIRALKIGKAAGNWLGNTRLGRNIPAGLRARVGRGFGRTVGGILGGAGKGGAGSGGIAGRIGGGFKGGGAGGAGGVAAVIVVVIAALVEFGKAVVAAADKQREAMFRYAEFSPSIAAVKGQADFRDAVRDFERGERLAASTQKLSDADQKLKDNSTDLIVLVNSIKNGVLADLETLVAGAVGALNEMAKVINKNFGIGSDKTELTAMDEFVEGIFRDQERIRQRGNDWHNAARADRLGR